MAVKKKYNRHLYKLRRVYTGEYITLTATDLKRMEVAVRLRLEACQENDEKELAKKWKNVHNKLRLILGWSLSG